MRLALVLLALALPAGAGELEEAARDLGSRDPARRARAARVLRAAGLKAATVLEDAVAHGDPEVRRHARTLLTAISTEALLERLRADDVAVRAAALGRLYEVEGDAAFTFLEKHLADDLAGVLTDVLFYEWDPVRRQEAVKLLARIGAPHSLRGLVWAIRDRIGHNKSVAQILGEQGDLTVLEDVRRAWVAGVPGARQAFHRIRRRERVRGPYPKEPLVDPRHFLRLVGGGETPGDRIRGIQALVTGLLDDERAADVAAKSLGAEPEATVRRWAARAFGYLKVPGREKALMAAVRDDGDRIVRLEACLALARGAPERVQAFLVGVASADEDRELRRAAASALGDIGDRAVAARLEGLIAEENDKETAAQFARTAARIRARIAGGVHPK